MACYRTALVLPGVVLACSASSTAAQSSMCTELAVEPTPQLAGMGEHTAPLAPPSELDAEAPQGPRPDEELPWCSSQDDPRCSKLPAGSVPTPHKAPAPASTALDEGALERSAFGTTQSYGARAGLRPQRAMRERLDRPPRACGRTR